MLWENIPRSHVNPLYLNHREIVSVNSVIITIIQNTKHMPVSKNRKGHAKKALQRKTEMIQYRNRMNNAYRQMYETLRNKSISMTDMLNQEDKLPGGPDQTNPAPYRSDTDGWKVIDAPVYDPNEPVVIASQWPADMQLPEVEQTLTVSAT